MKDDSQPSPTPRPARLRPWQFGLSTLLLMVAVCAVVSWWIAREEPWDQFQPRFTARIEKLGGEIKWGQNGAPTQITLNYIGRSSWEPTTDEDLKSLRGDLWRMSPFSLSFDRAGIHGPITDVGVQHLKGIRRLECLSLRHNDVTDAAIPVLAEIPGLKFVDLRGTKVTNRGLDALSASRPEVIAFTGGREPGAVASSWEAPRLEYSSPLKPLAADPDIGLAFWNPIDGKKRSMKFPQGNKFFIHDPEVNWCFLGPDEVLISLHGPISDSGVALARIELSSDPAKVVWEEFAEPLGVDHSKYRQHVHLFAQGDRCVLVSDGAETFVEIRDLATGALLHRWVY